MTQSFITQCPHCRTSFRVSNAQLNAAHGAVRCGACLHVFNAAQQLRKQGVDLSPVTAPRAPAPAPSKPEPVTPPPPSAVAPVEKLAPATDNTLWIHDDLDLGDLDLDEELAKLQAEELDLSKEFLDLDKPATNTAPLTASKTEEPADERWAEALLIQEQQDNPEPAPAQKPAIPFEVVELEPEKAEPSIGPLDNPEPEVQHTPINLREPHETAPLKAKKLERDPLAVTKPPRSPRLSDERLIELDDEPLQLNWQKPTKPWGRWLGWGLLNLLAAAGLAAQYVTYNFAELSRNDQYRPWFEQICPTLGCTLPSKVDIDQIKSSNLVVRSHPEFSGALVVDAIIYNRASFSQPFPLLEMRFADVNGKLLASRRFKPSEYLAGELAGNAEMPPQTPIHISLDILDPGAQAVNYSLSFHSPE